MNPNKLVKPIEIYPGLWIANPELITREWLDATSVDRIINLASGKQFEKQFPDIDEFRYSLTANELTEPEMNLARKRVLGITSDVKLSHQNGNTVLVDMDGMSTAAMIAAFFLIETGMDPHAALKSVEDKLEHNCLYPELVDYKDLHNIKPALKNKSFRELVLGGGC